VIIELFSLGFVNLRLRRYEQISIENRRFCSNVVNLARNFRYKVSFLPTILLVGIDLSYGMKMWGEDFSFYHSARV